MKKAAYCSVPFSLILCLILPGVAGAEAEQVQSPVGFWESVDFVEHLEDFQPGKRATQIELHLKDVELQPDGRTSISDTWNERVIVHKNGTTKAGFHIETIDGHDYLFFPWLSGDVTERGMKPWYYVLKKAPPGTTGPKKSRPRRGFRQIRPVDSVAEYDDVRWKDLSKIKPRRLTSVIATLDFNKDTVWPDIEKLPRAKRPDKLLDAAMNPGLGVRRLHQQGITGKCVNVAIIDQPLYQDHPEFKGKIAAYFDTGCGSQTSMHGPAVTSLLVGTQCGTAPDAKVYYAAAPSWKKDAAYHAKALDWLIEQNDRLGASKKIRLVSVSAAPSGPGSLFTQNNRMWDDACARAEAAGILVLDCTSHHGFIGPSYLDPASPESVTRCAPGYPGMRWNISPDKLYVPASPRTTAEQYQKDEYAFQYNGRGGLSWAIPYAAGVLAMGWQVNLELSAEQMKRLLFESAYTKRNCDKIINPRRFILLVKRTKPATVKR